PFPGVPLPNAVELALALLPTVHAIIIEEVAGRGVQGQVRQLVVEDLAATLEQLLDLVLVGRLVRIREDLVHLLVAVTHRVPTLGIGVTAAKCCLLAPRQTADGPVAPEEAEIVARRLVED